MQDQKAGALIGQKGVKYGLQRRAPQPAQTKAAAPKPFNIFGDDDSDEDDVGVQVARQAEKKKQDAKVAQLQAEALAQDPSVFSYDEVYEDMQATREVPKLQEKLARRPKYIEMLLKQAEERKKEQDIGWEKRQIKDREKEDYLFEGKERFVTSAYRKKLEEDKKWLEAERLRELEEEKADVRKVGHLGNFYKNLLTQNVAFGASKDKPTKAAADESQEGEEETRPKEPDAKVLAQAHQMEAEMDAYERMRLEAERAYRERAKAEQTAEGEGEGASDSGREEPEEEGGGNTRADPQAGPAGEASGTRRTEGSEPGTAAAAPSEALQDQGGKSGAGGRRKADEAAVSAARERYMARKKMKTGG